jgi:hypothetical protein
MRVMVEFLKPELLEELKSPEQLPVHILAKKYKVSRETIRHLAKRHGIVFKGARGRPENVNKGNEKYGMSWEEYVKVPGNIAWPDGVEPRMEFHETSSLGCLLKALEVWG